MAKAVQSHGDTLELYRKGVTTTPLFAKLNYKGHDPLVVLDAPESFESELAGLEGVTIKRSLDAAIPITFLLAFVTELAAIERVAVVLPDQAPGDPLIWFAYPKGSSKRYTCSFNRDTGWAALGAAGFEGVRQVAIDVDWSALRFRRASFIKNLTRDPKRRMT